MSRGRLETEGRGRRYGQGGLVRAKATTIGPRKVPGRSDMRSLVEGQQSPSDVVTVTQERMVINASLYQYNAE